MIKWMIAGLICYLFSGCQENRLEQALLLSGENRPELEKVLVHFSQTPGDSLKLRAAKFLISHMPEHVSYEGPALDNIEYPRDSVAFRDYSIERILYLRACQQWLDSLTCYPDIQHLKADFLIRHIEQAFLQKEQCPWLKDIAFDTFCEYLLPYRIALFNLEKSQDTTNNIWKNLQTACLYYDDYRSLITITGSYLQELRSWHYNPSKANTGHLQPPLTPNEEAQADWISLCSHGIPAALDFVPVSNGLSLPTCWVNILDPRLQEQHTESLQGLRPGKVYRRTYSHQPLPDPTEYIPSFFRDPFHRDVTDTYLNTCHPELTFAASLPTHYAYLCLYDAGEWSPVSYAPTQRKRVCFKQVGKNCIYLPACYPQGKQLALSDPFLLLPSGRQLHLTADPEHPQTITCQRMQPYFSWINSTNAWYAGSRFECSDDPEFKTCDTIYTISHRLYYGCESFRPDPTIRNRYYRLYTSNGYSNFAELQFLDSQNRPIPGTWIGPDTTQCHFLNDNQPFTNKHIYHWVGKDFGKPVSIAQISYMGTNDKHTICPGHRYELFYWSAGEWQSAGTQEATDFQVSFEGVPAHALYHLHDHTTNTKGCIFTWEKGRNRFW